MVIRASVDTLTSAVFWCSVVRCFGLQGEDVFKIPAVIAIGKAHGKSAAQVALRWLVQQNISAVTAAHNPAYIAEDSESPEPQATAIFLGDTFP